jgi:hypothetical protein
LATTSSTSASSSADESPESLPDAGGGGFELVTLQEWIRKEGGGAGGGDPVKCGGCEAPFLRGDEASICIACGSQRLTNLNNSYNNNATTKLDYKLSIAFSRFLETIHRSIEVLYLLSDPRFRVTNFRNSKNVEPSKGCFFFRE